MDLKEILKSLADPEFQAFTAGLMPNIPSGRVIGVRLPALRKLAKRIAGDDWRAYLKTASDDTFEEVMLQGMVIGAARAGWEELEPYVTGFLPKIDNWSVCDSFCSSLKIAKSRQKEVWDYLQGCLGDDREYIIRFGVVMIIFYYMEEEYAGISFEWFDRITHSGYYVKMAKAWAVSVFYVHFPDRTMEYLKDNRLDDWTYNKALQKITESLSVDPETKQRIRQMKRR